MFHIIGIFYIFPQFNPFHLHTYIYDQQLINQVTVHVKYWEKACNCIKKWTQNVTGWAEKLATNELKNIVKNDVGFAQPPSPSKMSLLILHSKY